MSACFKITSCLLEEIRADLRREHPFASERVGFLSAGLSGSDDRLLILAQEYRPVEDEDYLPDPSVGAMMGADALRKAFNWALSERVGIFHVHAHVGWGVPHFSAIDLRENARFVPDFFKVANRRAHGAIVLSEDSASGRFWLDRATPGRDIDEIIEVGTPLRTWSLL